MRKGFCFFFALALALGCAACGGQSREPESGSASEASSRPSRRMEDLAQNAAALTAEDLLGAELSARLAQRGITAGVEEVALTDEEHLAFTLTLARAGAGPLRLPMDASLRYLITETGAVRNFTAIWGGVSLADRDTVAVCDLKTIALYDADTLEKLDFTPDLSRHAGGECDLVGVVRDPALGVVALYADEENDGFLCFDVLVKYLLSILLQSDTIHR